MGNDVFSLPDVTENDISGTHGEPSRLVRYPQPVNSNSPRISDVDSFTVPEIKEPNVYSDVFKSAAGQGTLGVTADIASIPRSLIDTASAIPSAAGNSYLNFVAPNNEIAQQFGSSLGKDLFGPALDAGKYIYNKAHEYLPSQEDLEKFSYRNLPFTQYTPQTEAGKYAGSAARMATNAAALSGAGSLVGSTARSAKGADAVTAALKAASRGATEGAAAGTVSQAGGELGRQIGPGETSPDEMYGRLLGTYLGQLAGSNVADIGSKILNPKSAATTRLSKALSQDIKSKTGSLSESQIRSAINSGSNVMPLDLAGEKTRDLLANSNIDPLTGGLAGSINEGLENRRAAIPNSVGSHIDSLYTDSVDAGSLSKQGKAIAKREDDIAFGLARAHPNASSMLTPELERLSNIDAVQSAMKKVDKIATDEKSELFPGSPGRPGTPDIQVPTGVLDSQGNPIMYTKPGTPAIPPQGPNLSYWHLVKRSLAENGQTAAKDGDFVSKKYSDIQKNALHDEISRLVPEYGDAVTNSAKAFDADDALHAGYKSVKNMDTFNHANFIADFNKMSDYEKQVFSHGAATALKEMAESGSVNNPASGVKSLITTMSDPQKAERLRLALGDEKFDSIYQKALSENNLSKTKPITSAGQTPSILDPILRGSMDLAARSAPYAIMGGLSGGLSLGSVTGGLAAGIGLAAKAASSYGEKLIAPHVLRLAGDPSKTKELLDLAKSNPDAASLLRRAATYTGMMSSRMPSAIPSQMPQTVTAPNNEQAYGGRIVRASGGRADRHEHLVGRLMKMADSAKKISDQTTETFLNAPDESIVKALAVAKKGI